eukprot:m.108393 g.108393  ORF g.108393 m.108393 type:complete len:386 (-) comp10658_c0_seq1:1108-2265(-)
MGNGKGKLSHHIDDLPAQEKYFGFTNFGQTCYMNAVLQALYACRPFRAALLQQMKKGGDCAKGSGSDRDDKENLLVCIASLFAQVSHNKKRMGVITPSKFFNRLRRDNPMYTRTQQQDAQEFLIFLVNRLSELIKKDTDGSEHGSVKGSRLRASSKGSKGSKSSDDTSCASSSDSSEKQTWIEEIFEGRLRTETRCLNCESVQTRDEPFINLSVPIAQNTSITGCLREFSAAEILRGDNKYYCDTCCSYQEADKGLKVHEQPKILIVQLKRFEYHERYQCLTKLSARVPFPLELKLFNTTADADDQIYELQAVVAHLGSRLNSGHYIAVVRSADYWLLYDDRTVQIVPEEFLERLFGMTDTQKSSSSWCDTAYILFYTARKESES